MKYLITICFISLMILSINNVSAFSDNFNDDDISDWVLVHGIWDLPQTDNFSGEPNDYYLRGKAEHLSGGAVATECYQEIGLHDAYEFDIKGFGTHPVTKYYYNEYNQHYYYWDYENNLGIHTEHTGDSNGERRCTGIGFTMSTYIMNYDEWYRIYIQHYDTYLRIRIYDKNLLEVVDENCEYTKPDITTGTFRLKFYSDYNAGTGYGYGFIDNIETSSHTYTPGTPSLTTDKLTYNTSEQITITNENIYDLETGTNPKAIYVVYSIIDDFHDYEAKFMQWMLYNEADESFTIPASILQPQTQYYLIVADSGSWSRIEDAFITSSAFYVYPDEEYLTTSCSTEGNCYLYNNDILNIYYSIINNSDIIIKDNDDDVITTFYNIQGTGTKTYTIPADLNQLNSYPNWKVFLNNSAPNTTSFNSNVTVYWSLFVESTPTPYYTPTPTDENVSEMVDSLKEESEPILQLLFGLTEIIIDNPDYDNDNIVSEGEMNNWFNSLIPMCIVLLLIILYMGLKGKKR